MGRNLLRNLSTLFALAISCLVVVACAANDDEETALPHIGANAIGGTVTSPTGPEAGVWVIAEQGESGSRYVKIVVTDEQGRFVLPELPRGTYKVWSRGYGLVDSKPMTVSTGQSVQLEAQPASTPVEAAQIYPANYWFSLLDVPEEGTFPGSGPEGNDISPAMKTQQHWLAHTMENCQFCHQLGNEATREMPAAGDPMMVWKQRILKGRSPDDRFFVDDDSYQGRHYGQRMTDLMNLFGGDTGVEMFADWTTRIAEGEVPPAPSRPEGIERNIVVTIRDMGEGRFIHDTVSTDKRNPTINANGSIYGTNQFSGMITALDPNTGENSYFKLTGPKGKYFKHAGNHTLTMDSKRRVWMSDTGHFHPIIEREYQGENPEFCTDPDNKFAAYFPRPFKEARLTSVLDTRTGDDALVPVCFGTHHLNLDTSDRLYWSGDTEVVGWIDVDVWDKTGDAEKAVGWCPFVLDTNGDGKISPDRENWNLQLEGIAGGEGADFREEDEQDEGLQTRYIDRPVDVMTTDIDPEKDTRVAGFNYGMGVSPTDQSYWAAKYTPYVPSGILRVETGNNPPETCKTEYYEAPRVDGKYTAFNARGVDVDYKGIAWVAFGSGHIGKFDRSKCEVMNGPSATGQHCPEGWEIIDTPGPKLKDTESGSDWFYLTFVDNHNTFGLGKGVPFFPNSVGDELLAYLPEKEEFVHLRVPYPMGFYPRILDGRIDSKSAGWKGRGVWSGNHLVPLWHQETGEGSTEYAAHFQLRPDPLAQ